MPCQTTNFSSDYSQCAGVTPEWFILNDGCNNPLGCIPIAPAYNQPRRRFSPYCRYIEVSPGTPQVFLRVAPSVQADSQSLTFTNTHAQMQVSRKGCGTPVGIYPAFRRDANGYIGFYFDQRLFCGPSGYYVGDVFLDCVYCFSVTLRLPPCETVVTDCYVVPVLETCNEGVCGVLDAAGGGIVGGLECNQPPAPSVCGPVAPYFPQDNPAPPAPTCDPGQGCALALVPSTPCGITIA